MLGGIQYLLNITEGIFTNWGALLIKSENKYHAYAMRRLIDSRWRYVLAISVVAPFYLFDWIPPIKQTFYEHFLETYLPIYSIQQFHTSWGLIFDVYLQVLGLLGLFLLSIILWIMFNITWTLGDRDGINCSFSLETCVFNTKMRNTSIKNSIFRVLFYYFACISLAILSYFNPRVFFSRETGFLLLLLLIGILFFFFGLDAIHRALEDQIKNELEEINRRSQDQVQKLKTITSVNSKGENDEIIKIANVLDIFRKQREELEHINTNSYDISSNVKFISMLILPVVAGIFRTALDNSTVMSIINQGLANRINETINMIISYKF